VHGLCLSYICTSSDFSSNALLRAIAFGTPLDLSIIFQDTLPALLRNPKANTAVNHEALDVYRKDDFEYASIVKGASSSPVAMGAVVLPRAVRFRC
jgi:hypothetical protein